MSDQYGRQQPFRFWFPYWRNQTPPRPLPSTRGRSQPRPPAPSSQPAETPESQAQQKIQTSEAPSQPPPTTRRPSRNPSPSLSPSASASPSRRSPRFQPSDQRPLEQPSPARLDAQPRPPSTASAQPQPASGKDSRPPLPSPSGAKEQAPTPSLNASQVQQATQGGDKFPSPPATSQLPRTPSRVTAQPQPESRKVDWPSPRDPVEQAPGPTPSPGASQPQPAILGGGMLQSPSPQATSQPKSTPDQPKVLPQKFHTLDTILPKIPEQETQVQASQSKESTLRPPPSQSKESQDWEPKPVPSDSLEKDVPAETVPKTPNHPLQSENQPKETKEKPQNNTRANQESKPYILPKPKVLPRKSHTLDTILPKFPEQETQVQASQSKESIPKPPPSQSKESQDWEPKPVPSDSLVKDVPAETVPKTPNHPLQSEIQPKETKENPQKNTGVKQEPKPYILPKLDQKHEDIPDEKAKTETDVDQQSIETSKTEKNSDEIKADSKRKTENTQEMHPTRSQKQEKYYEETKVEPKTRSGVKQEMGPKEAVKSVPRPEAIKEYNQEGPKPEIISKETKQEPRASADVRRERNPNEVTKDGPRLESNKGYIPKTTQEIDDNKHHRVTEESITKLEPKLAVLESDFNPSRSQLNTSELTQEDRISEVEQKRQNNVSGKTVITQNGSNRRESRIVVSTVPSMGEQTNLQKEIKEGLSKLVQKLSIQQQPGGDQGVSIITLAGKNKGATMIVGYEAVDREGSMKRKGDYKTKANVIAISDNDAGHEQLNHAENGNPDITTNINSNVQSINNSVLHDCSCCQGDPGVQLNISSKPKGSVYLIERKETLKKSATSILQPQKLTYEPRVRRRCLRGLLLESSESDPENQQKPRRHGCRVSCVDKKAEDEGISSTSRNRRHNDESTSKV